MTVVIHVLTEAFGSKPAAECVDEAASHLRREDLSLRCLECHGDSGVVWHG